MKKKWDDLKQLRAYKLIKVVDEWMENLVDQINKARQTLEQYKLRCKTMDFGPIEETEPEVVKLMHNGKVVGYIVKHPDICDDPHKKKILSGISLLIENAIDD